MAIGEYWLKQESKCSFLSNQNSKVTWYSESVSAEYHMYYDQGNFDCRANLSSVDPYPNGLDVILGADNDNACLVKFILKNENQNHDLRVQYFKEFGPLEGERTWDNARYLSVAAATALAAVAYVF